MHHALAATGGVHERLRVKDAFQAALKAGLGHAVEQVPGGADVHALALELGRHVIEEGGQVLGHLGLQLVERLFLFQQFRADHQAIEGALGLCRAQLGAQVQHVGAEGGRVRRMEMRFVGQQRRNHRRVDAHMAQVTLAVVGVDGVQVGFRGVRAVHVPHHHLAQLRELVPLVHALGQERQGAGRARGVADAQLWHAFVHGFEPVVQALAIADIDRGDGLCHLRRHQLAQPLVDLGEAAFLQQRWRVGLVDGVFEQQRHHVVELLDLVHALGVGEFLEDRDALAQFGEALLEGIELQRVDFRAGQMVPGVLGIVDQLCRVVQQLLGFLFYRQLCSGHCLARYSTSGEPARPGGGCGSSMGRPSRFLFRIPVFADMT
ncbi:hypothetical protein D3C76_622920 [compost metagenome]